MSKPFNVKTFVIKFLRQASYRYPARNEVLTKARISRGVYKCNCCDGHFGRTEVQVDHIDPIIPVTGWDDWNGFIERLFCGEDKMQCICKPCHNSKSYLENQLRKQHKQKSIENDEEIEDI